MSSINALVLVSYSRWHEMKKACKEHVSPKELAGSGIENDKLDNQEMLQNQTVISERQGTSQQHNFTPAESTVQISEVKDNNLKKVSPIKNLLKWVRPSRHKKALRLLHFLMKAGLLLYRESSLSYKFDGRVVTKNQLSHLFQFVFQQKAGKMLVPLAASILKPIVLARHLESYVDNEYFKSPTDTVESTIVASNPATLEAGGKAWYVLE